MLSKTMERATAAAMVLVACGCSQPWKDEPINQEVNVSFTLRQNLIHLTNVRVGSKPGRMILGTATPTTIIDTRFETTNRGLLMLGAGDSVQVRPLTGDLGGVAEAIIGADAWQKRTITIDYRSGLVTWQKGKAQSWEMILYRYPEAPAVEILVDGVRRNAIVDTSSPDTLVLPAGERRRGMAHVVLGGTDFGPIDVQYADIPQARVGNRLLSRFLVTIDYGRHLVGLWRDPRIPLKEPAAARETARSRTTVK